MIGRGFRRNKATEEVEAKGFDAFELRLGDLMRGERATMGKSLLDVQRELKIKAAYIAAIENADPTAFDTPGFIAGYVRSYARYLNMDPDWAFETFSRESGFATAHGMSAAASSVKPSREERLAAGGSGKDIFVSSATPFIPAGERMFSGVEPKAVGSMLVLVALIGGLGYGGWSVLQEVQKVQFAPVEQAPTVVAEIDPLSGGTRPEAPSPTEVATILPSPEALDRLYRPQALDVPVMVARDGPIVGINPAAGGVLVAEAPDLPTAAQLAQAEPVAPAQPDLSGVRVTEGPAPEVMLVAVRPAWVRVRSADGSTLYEGIMDAGDSYAVPATEEPATLRIGESGAVYFAVNGTAYGPVGPRGTVTSNVALSVENLTSTYQVADLDSDSDLAELVNVAEVQISE
ncbi:helix-turn-helix domain-containing protein [Flavimaricola marinus]|uniref:Cytoskeletal protein RodZ n=1 Tax=Flavimaricola marinus TaxID=1819565 RepID=A0A238LG08_9RHOB|nr:helix-turn-helix domain-containing protein [Flavimaricola marinus]SMY07896.1 cytoskeletal protein RodZ [Flavimaricola marinus]